MSAKPCIVMRDGKPMCRVALLSNRQRSGILVADPSRPAHIFPNTRAARRAIDRTTAAGTALRGTLLADWPKLRAITHGGPFSIVEVTP